MDLVREDAGDAGDLLAEQVSQLGSARGDLFQTCELPGGHGGLRLAHPVVGGQHARVLAFVSHVPFVAEPLQDGAKTLVVRGDHAAISARHVFRILQREAGQMPHGADRSGHGNSHPMPARSLQSAPSLWRSARALSAIQIARIAQEVDGDDRLGLGRDPPLDVGHVEGVVVRVLVGKHGDRLLEEDADDGPHGR